MEKVIRRADLLLAAGALLLAAVLFFALRAFRAPGAAVRVTVDGKVVGEYALAEDREIVIPSPGGRNVLVIEDGRARMTEADLRGSLYEDCHQDRNHDPHS